MRKIKISLLTTVLLLISLLCICCPSKKAPENTIQEPPVIETPIAESEPEQIPQPVSEPVVEAEPLPEPEPVIVSEQKAETVKESDDEYLRSTNNLSQEEKVTKEEFSDDKSAVLLIINNLSDIMERKDSQEWLKYIEPTSKDYYSNITNLKKAQKKLPNKSLKLNNIEDYFIYVFIPSRKRSQVDEIRYISKNSIKAVQVKDDKSIVVYYYFTKVNGKWMVHLPPIS